jgi:hypothetical protein
MEYGKQIKKDMDTRIADLLANKNDDLIQSQQEFSDLFQTAPSSSPKASKNTILEKGMNTDNNLSIHKRILNKFDVNQQDILSYNVDSALKVLSRNKKDRLFYFIIVIGISLLMIASYFLLMEIQKRLTEKVSYNDQGLSIEDSVNQVQDLYIRAENLRQENIELRQKLLDNIEMIKKTYGIKISNVERSNLVRQEKILRVNALKAERDQKIQSLNNKASDKIAQNENELTKISSKMDNNNQTLSRKYSTIRNANPSYFNQLEKKSSSINKNNSIKNNIYQKKAQIYIQENSSNPQNKKALEQQIKQINSEIKQTEKQIDVVTDQSTKRGTVLQQVAPQVITVVKEVPVVKIKEVIKRVEVPVVKIKEVVKRVEVPVTQEVIKEVPATQKKTYQKGKLVMKMDILSLIQKKNLSPILTQQQALK